MKKFLFALIILLQINGFAQYTSIVGTQAYGGSHRNGMVFKTQANNPASMVPGVEMQGNGNTGPYNNDLFKASNGIIYGTSRTGGAFNSGYFFRYEPSTEEFVILQEFSFMDGIGVNPIGQLLEHNGYLYGVNTAGGTFNGGTVFKFQLSTETFAVLHAFNNTGGAGNAPVGGLIFGPNALLYGFTRMNGGSSLGTIYAVDPTNGTFTDLYIFDGTNGRNPIGSPVFAADGMTIIGNCNSGGANGQGTLFTYDVVLDQYVNRLDLNTASGYYCSDGWYAAIDGNYYLPMYYGGTSNFGAIIRMLPDFSASTFYSFDNTVGANPGFDFILDLSGKVYGTCTLGGNNGFGTLYQLDYNFNTVVKIKDFTDSIGISPGNGLLLKQNGVIMGMASFGGTSNAGTIYTYEAAQDTLYKSMSFSDRNAVNPIGSLVNINNKLVGVSAKGGKYNRGTIYEHDPIQNTVTRINDFTSVAGYDPNSGLTQGDDGLYYGVCAKGSVLSGDQYGTIYSYNPSDGTITKRSSFVPAATGSTPKYELVKVNSDLFYGLTTSAGTYGSGAIFEFVPSTNTITMMYYLNVNFGELLRGGLTDGGNGKYYAITNGTNWNCGIMEFDPAGPSATVYDVSAGFMTGMNGIGTMVRAGNGNLYGVMTDGGDYGYGVLFEYVPGASAVTILHHFDDQVGNPTGAMLWGTNDNKLYGVCAHGGAWGKGAMFEYNLSGSGFTELDYFTGPSDRFFIQNALIEYEYPAPTEPTPIVSNSNFCANILQTFTTSADYAEYFDWNFPAGAVIIDGDGTDSVTVDFSAVTPGLYDIWARAWNVVGPSYSPTKQISVKAVPTVGLTADDYIACEGQGTMLYASGTPTYNWSTGETTSSIAIYPTVQTNYWVVGTGSNGCKDTATVTIAINPLPIVNYDELIGSVCTTASPFILQPGSPSGGSYSGIGVLSNTFNPQIAGVGVHEVVYAYTDGNGCIGRDTSYIMVDACAGMNDEIILGLHIYPNPAKDHLNIYSEVEYTAAVLRDTQGKLVKEINGEDQQIELQQIENGVYFLTIYYSNQQLIKKIVVQH